MSPLSIIREIDKCNNSATRAISVIGKLDNEDFVAFVRETRDVQPGWWTAALWKDAVDCEIRMRSLLGWGGGHGGVVLD